LLSRYQDENKIRVLDKLIPSTIWKHIATQKKLFPKVRFKMVTKKMNPSSLMLIMAVRPSARKGHHLLLHVLTFTVFNENRDISVT